MYFQFHGFFRVTAYRELTQLVYRYSGAQRFRLPARTYHVTRKEFGCEGDTLTGYEEDE